MSAEEEFYCKSTHIYMNPSEREGTERPVCTGGPAGLTLVTPACFRWRRRLAGLCQLNHRLILGLQPSGSSGPSTGFTRCFSECRGFRCHKLQNFPTKAQIPLDFTQPGVDATSALASYEHLYLVSGGQTRRITLIISNSSGWAPRQLTKGSVRVCVCVCGRVEVEREGGVKFFFSFSASPPITIHYYKLGFNKIAIQR